MWTAGVKPSPVLAKLGLPLDRGEAVRSIDDARRSRGICAGGRRGRPGAPAPGRAAVWAIGDCAAVPDPHAPGRSARRPPSTRSARAGSWPATWPPRLGSGRIRPFRYRTKGVVAELGRNKAVAITLGIRWRGFPAWFIARTYHLLLMPGLGRKLRLLVDWNVALLFGRDASSPGRLGSPTPLGHD